MSEYIKDPRTGRDTRQILSSFEEDRGKEHYYVALNHDRRLGNEESEGQSIDSSTNVTDKAIALYESFEFIELRNVA